MVVTPSCLSPEALGFIKQGLVSWLAGHRLNCRLPGVLAGGMMAGALRSQSRGRLTIERPDWVRRHVIPELSREALCAPMGTFAPPV